MTALEPEGWVVGVGMRSGISVKNARYPSPQGPQGVGVEEAKGTEGHHDAALRGGGLGRIDSHGASS